MKPNERALVRAALRWAEQDPDPDTAAELRALVETRDFEELRERMAGEVAFGTAGLRALVGAGPQRMNVAVIRRITLAVVQHLLATHDDASVRPVVVGCDARLSSAAFLDATVGVLTGAGLDVRFFPDPVPTPIVAYAARQLNATAAIVITASHNPRQYNGYKLYAANGAQIVPPTDEEIDALRRGVGPANEIPLGIGVAGDGTERVAPVPQNIVDRYFLAVDALRPAGEPARNLPIVYSALHGVGWAAVRRSFERAGFSNVTPVPQQVAPDGTFPTVDFPNPEEPGAMDLAIALADQTGAKLVLANDPDADRMAACVRDPAGKWFQLTGNQVGLLLADFILPRVPGKPRPLAVSSIVSSPMLGSIAQAYNARFERTLTGFKWIWNAALDLEQQEDVKFAFGYEEALGYSTGDIVRDKDGISAAVLFAELAALLESEGSSVEHRLAELYHQHGLWVSLQRSVVREGPEGRQQLEAAIERIGLHPPERVAEHEVTAFVDYRTGEESRPRWLCNNPLLELKLGAAGRVLLRPSGTEPKLKIYVDLRREVDDTPDVWASEEPALAEADAICQEIVRLSGLG